jgi:hypothetical protein
MTSINSVVSGTAQGYVAGHKSTAEQAPEPNTQTPDKLKAADGGPAYASPVTNVDPSSGVTIMVYRDASTGKELNQYPSKQVVAEYTKGAKRGGDSSSAEDVQGVS